jgi:WD40 repeat protein
MTKSLMKIHHPTSVRSLVFSPCFSHPLQAVVGLDNGSIYRWDLQMGQRGQLDRLPVAHAGPILALDWCNTPSTNSVGDAVGADRSWIVSGGLDHTVKARCFCSFTTQCLLIGVQVWDLNTSGTSVHIAHQPTYTLHPSFPVRRVLWRPEFPTEIAVVSNGDFGGSSTELLASPRLQSATPSFINSSASLTELTKDKDSKGNGAVGDVLEIWDVRRSWIAKWTVEASASECGVTGRFLNYDSSLFGYSHIYRCHIP